MKHFSCRFPAFVSACVVSVAVGAARPQYGGTLRVETQATIRGLDPAAVAVDPGDAALVNRIRPLIFETLVGINPGGGLRPLLATSWDSDTNGARWRFKLRSRVTLHDGMTLDSGQVAASLRSTSPGWTVATDGDAVVVTPPRPNPALAWELTDGRYAVAV